QADQRRAPPRGWHGPCRLGARRYFAELSRDVRVTASSMSRVARSTMPPSARDFRAALMQPGVRETAGAVLAEVGRSGKWRCSATVLAVTEIDPLMGRDSLKLNEPD